VFPGDVIVRFGTKDGANDIGETRIPAQSIHPLFDLMYKAKIRPVRLDPSKLYFFEVRTLSGKAPLDCYRVYGPKQSAAKTILLTSVCLLRFCPPPKLRWRPVSSKDLILYAKLLGPYTGGPLIIAADAAPVRPDELSIKDGWSIRAGED